MKKNIALIFIFLLIGNAFLMAMPYAQLYTYPTNKPSFLAPKLAGNSPITYCVYIGEAVQQKISVEDMDHFIHLAFKLWTAYPANAIRQSGRSEELAVELEILERDPNLQRLPVCDFSAFPKEKRDKLPLALRHAGVPRADLSFFVDDALFAETTERGIVSPYFTFRPIPHIVIPERKTEALMPTVALQRENKEDGMVQLFKLQKEFIATPNADAEKVKILLEKMEDLNGKLRMMYSLPHLLTHEIGHAIGLADQTVSADNEDLIYGSIRPRRSIMDNGTTFLTCDDADGIVLMLGREKGARHEDYASLCPKDSTHYSDGKEVFTGTRTREFSSRNGSSIRTYYEDTRKTGIYFKEESLYIDLEDPARVQRLYEQLDRQAMPRKGTGYQHYEGKMKMIDMENDPDTVVRVGTHIIRITLGAGAPYKQLVTEEYDDEGNLLSSKREIFKEGVLVKTEILK